MTFIKQQTGRGDTIGELLTAAGLVRPEQIEEALKVAKRSSTPFGRVLVICGFLREADLEIALEAQKLIRTKGLPRHLGLKGIKLASQRDLPLAQALASLDWTPPAPVSVMENKLGALLLEAELVSRSQLDDALTRTSDNGMPLGRVLVTQRLITPSTLAAALSAQVMMRDGKLRKDQAVKALKQAARRGTTLEQNIPDTPGGTTTKNTAEIRIGELFNQADLISEADQLAAVEIGLDKMKRTGDILVNAGLIHKETLEACLRIQEMVSNGTLDRKVAPNVLRIVQTEGVSLNDAIARFGSSQQQNEALEGALQMLTKAGILGPQEVHSIFTMAGRFVGGIGEALRQSQLVEPNYIQAALHCCQLVSSHKLKAEQAIIALGYSCRSRISIADALEELTWDLPVASA